MQILLKYFLRVKNRSTGQAVRETESKETRQANSPARLHTRKFTWNTLLAVQYQPCNYHFESFSSTEDRFFPAGEETSRLTGAAGQQASSELGEELFGPVAPTGEEHHAQPGSRQ